MEITVNSHSSIRIEAEIVVRCDPFHVQNAPHDAALVLITHDHYDHFSPEDIRKVARPNTVFVVPQSLEAAISVFGRSVMLLPGEKVTVHGITIEAIAAYNQNKPFHPRKNNWLGYRITCEGKKLYICGDTDNTPESRSVQCDVLLLPVGGTYTMDVTQASELAKAIRPALAIPTHYGSVTGNTTDGMDFCRLLEGVIPTALKVEDAQLT